ncbi:hypothetical protein HDR58_02365 [bacterium]|nr:hypothetical protein [bacterium]
MIIKPAQYRAIRNFCTNSTCPLKSITERLHDIRTGKLTPAQNLVSDTIQLSYKPNLEAIEKQLGRKLELSPMTEAQTYTNSICNSISFNKTIDCINDNIGIYGKDSLTQTRTKEFVAKTDKALFEEIPKTTKDVLLYRGESYSPRSERLQEILALKPGSSLKSDRYTYLTDNYKYAQNFQKSNNVQVFYKVLVPKNSNIALHTLEKGCAVAPRDVQHQIVDIEKGIGKVTITSILNTAN